MSIIVFVKVDNDEKIDIISEKANIIWHEYFPGIISVEQIDYMVDMFLAPRSIRREIQEGYEFYLQYKGDENIGFMVAKPEKDRLFISKLYVDKEHRGQGYGNYMFEKAQEICVSNNLNSMYLTVNKYNTPSIEVYKSKGFKIIQEVETDIGHGFVMDDYVMEKKLSKKEIAMSYFKMGYNCSQSVVLAFADKMKMDSKDLARMASSFGGGLGRMREVCGAVSGMAMVAGMLYGYDNPEEYDKKSELYSRIQELAGRFTEKEGSIICREMLGLDGVSKPIPEKRTDSYYQKRPCVQFVGDAAEILDRYINLLDK